MSLSRRTEVRPLAAILLSLAVSSGCQSRFERLRDAVMIHSGERTVTLDGEDSRVLVTPGLNGRVLTTTVGPIESVAYVNYAAIERGETNESFNNFGGQDRFWIGPEAESFGIYFEPGAEQSRENWRVPEDLNRGAMEIVSRDGDVVVLRRAMSLQNYRGVAFDVRVEREIGLVPGEKLNEELGVRLPAGVDFAGSYSLNRLTNVGEAPWKRDTGALCIWILGQFPAGERAVIIAPFHAGDAATLGEPFNDDYFGDVSEQTPGRLAVVGDAVVFRADGKREGKIGVSARRTKGVAGSYDPDRAVLIICAFDYDPDSSLYGSFTWNEDNPEPYSGDAFQAYNGDSRSNAENAFYELESASPCAELSPGATIQHRHATFCFHGDPEKLETIADRVLGVSLEEAVRAVAAKPERDTSAGEAASASAP